MQLGMKAKIKALIRIEGKISFVVLLTMLNFCSLPIIFTRVLLILFIGRTCASMFKIFLVSEIFVCDCDTEIFSGQV